MASIALSNRLASFPIFRYISAINAPFWLASQTELFSIKNVWCVNLDFYTVRPPYLRTKRTCERITTLPQASRRNLSVCPVSS